MDAAQIVVSVVRDIALQGTYGASLEELWTFTQACLPNPLDDKLKRAVWSWITQHPEIIPTDNGMPLQDEVYKPLDELQDRQLRVYATESEQWMALTGRKKERNPVGPNPFDLLCAVSRAREKGLTSVEIHKVTGQDPRSIFGRVQLLASLGLVKKFPVTKDSTHTHLVIFSDFCKKTPETEESTINKTKLYADMVALARESPNGLVLYGEVYRKLGLDKKANGAKSLAQLCYTLETKGCVQRVQVHSPNNPRIHFKCVKFLKEFEGEVPDVEEDDEEDEEIVEQQVDLANVVEVSQSLTSFNSFWPLEAQIYSLVRQTGKDGMSAMDITRILCGESWNKVTSMLLPMYAWNEKLQKQFSWVALERGLDFIQKLKYYRYFTRVTHCQFTNKPLPAWGYFGDVKQALKTLHDLNIVHSTIASGICSIIKDKSGRIRPLFHGEKIAGTTLMQNDQGGKKRGRPKKTDAGAPVPSAPKAAYTPQKSTLKPVAQREWVGGAPAVKNPPALQLVVGDDVRGATMIAPTLSLAMNRRIQAITTILDAHDGAVEGSANLCRLIDEHLQEDKALDRKTLKKVLELLEERGTIKQRQVDTWSANGVMVSRPIVYHVDAKPEVVDLLSEQIKSRLQARRNLGAPNNDLPQETVEIDKVQALFTTVETKPKRLKRLLQQSLQNRKRKEKPPKMRFGPRASSLVNIPGRSDPNHFVMRTGPGARPAFENPELKRVAEEPLEPAEAPVDDDMLFRCVIIARTLYGKNETAIEWDLVTSCIVGLKNRRARKRWITLRDNFGGAKAVQRATYQWETLFVKHYEAGTVEYRDRYAANFDMRYYVDFWRAHHPSVLSSPLWKHNHSRLLSRKEYEAAFGVIKVKSVTNPLDQVTSMPSMVKVEELLMATSYSWDPRSNLEATKFSSDEQLIRRVCGAEDFNAKAHEEKLLEIGESRVKAAVESLQARKFIMYLARNTEKVLPGRNYTFTDKMIANLSYKFGDDLWRVAREYESYKGIIPPTVLDNQMVALLDLCASGLVELIRPNIKTGRITSNYQSRGISQDLLNFDVEAVPTQDVPSAPKPGPYPIRPNLVWGDKLFESVAKKLVTLIQSKPGIPRAHIYSYLSGFSKDEIEAAMEWLKGFITEGGDGSFAKPRWYRVFDA